MDAGSLHATTGRKGFAWNKNRTAEEQAAIALAYRAGVLPLRTITKQHAWSAAAIVKWADKYRVDRASRPG